MVRRSILDDDDDDDVVADQVDMRLMRYQSFNGHIIISTMVFLGGSNNEKRAQLQKTRASRHDVDKAQSKYSDGSKR